MRCVSCGSQNVVFDGIFELCQACGFWVKRSATWIRIRDAAPMVVCKNVPPGWLLTGARMKWRGEMNATFYEGEGR